MNSLDIVRRVVSTLEEQGVPYMLVGSFSSNVWGVVRATKDMDVVVQLDGHSIHEVVGAMGEDFQLEPQMSFESVTGTTRYNVDVSDSEFRVELFKLSDDPHDRERFDRRVRAYVDVIDCDAYLATAEDVVVTKLRWAADAGRSKDREDVDSVVRVSGRGIDWDYVHRWADEHGTRELLDDIRADIPDID